MTAGLTGKTVVIVGGGLAGLAAATRLVQEGFSVTLIEKRAILGGRASSALHPEGSGLVDNCQHVLLECCTALIRFYRRIGCGDKITFHDHYTFIEPGGRRSLFRAIPWFPKPFHLVPSLARLKFLTLRDKIGVAWALLWIALTPRRFMDGLDRVNFHRWLRRRGQSDAAMKRFWNTILVSALNEDLEHVSAKYAFKTFKEGFLSSRTAYRMGVPNIPLQQLYTEPSLQYLDRGGARVIFQKKAASLSLENDTVQAIGLSDGSWVRGDHFILAVPFNELLEIVPDENPYWTQVRRLQTSPIVGVHLFFDRPITDLQHAVLLDSEIQWVFNKTSVHPVREGEQYLQVVVSAARHFIELSKSEAVGLAIRELERFFPDAGRAKLLRSIVIKEFRATFSPRPQADESRPDQSTPLKNLWIAGDWTRTGWPATMESAVRSGEIAAERIIERCASQHLQ